MKKTKPSKGRPPDVSWLPALADNGGPIYRQLLAALESDISAGRLRSGVLLPTQRALAVALNVSPGTVTKAYEEAKRMGLVQGNVGRGTFINRREGGTNGASGRVVDLSLNMPGRRMSSQVLSAAITKIGRRTDLGDYEGYVAHPGIAEHRAAFADALSRIGYEPSIDNMVITNGAQHGMQIAILALCDPGATVLTEAATYHGMKSLAEFFHLRLRGVEMDDQGLVPGAFAAACEQSNARVLFTMPTLQNPTARTMNLQRRREVIDIARKYDVMIVEDDVYGFLAAEASPPLAHLAPERTFYINSVSKCVLPALRIGVLVSPPAFLPKVYRAMRATSWMASPLASLMAATWMEDGTVRSIVDSMRKEAAIRTRLAVSILGDALPPKPDPSFHLWMEMRAEDVARVTGFARNRGVITTPMSAPLVDDSLTCGLRLSIGAPDRIEDLEWALRIIAEGLRDDSERNASII